MKCRHWDKTPDCFGSEPQCAFDEEGDFIPNNWNCALMNKIRDKVLDREVWCEDQHMAVLPIFDTGEFIIVSYYKHRGRTDRFWISDGQTIRRGCESDVTRFVEAEKEADKIYGRNRDTI